MKERKKKRKRTEIFYLDYLPYLPTIHVNGHGLGIICPKYWSNIMCVV